MANNNRFYDSSKNRTGYYGYSSETRGLTPSGNKKSSSKRSKKNSAKLKRSATIGVILALIQLALSVFFVKMVLDRKISFLNSGAPLIIMLSVLALLLFIVLRMQAGKLSVKRAGKVISVIVSLVLAAGMYFLHPVRTMSGTQVSTTEPFVVFVSANDTFGTMGEDEIGRSDTNIIAVVNPKTHIVLMVSTPRDYYLEVDAKSVAPGSYDKLTHHSLYGNGVAYNDSGDLGAADWTWAYEVSWHPGLDVIMNSMKNLYAFNVPDTNYHYVRINFTGFANMVDDLGGITVNVEVPFTTEGYDTYDTDQPTGDSKTYIYTEGEMEMDGATALTFARERHSFADGDMQRNRDQVLVLEAISDKLLSADSMLNWSNVMNDIQDSFVTDIDLSSLISLQTKVSTQSDYDGWKIIGFSTIGQPDRNVCTYTGTSLSVTNVNQDSVNRAKSLIDTVIKGEADEAAVRAMVDQYNKEQAE